MYVHFSRSQPTLTGNFRGCHMSWAVEEKAWSLKFQLCVCVGVILKTVQETALHKMSGSGSKKRTGGGVSSAKHEWEWQRPPCCFHSCVRDASLDRRLFSWPRRGFSTGRKQNLTTGPQPCVASVFLCKVGPWCKLASKILLPQEADDQQNVWVSDHQATHGNWNSCRPSVIRPPMQHQDQEAGPNRGGPYSVKSCKKQSVVAWELKISKMFNSVC